MSHQVEQAATELQTFSQLKKQEDIAIPRRQEVNLTRENSNRRLLHCHYHLLFVDVWFLGVFFLFISKCLTSSVFVLMLGPTGGCGEANGEGERTSAAIRRAADGEGGPDQQWD